MQLGFSMIVQKAPQFTILYLFGKLVQICIIILAKEIQNLIRENNVYVIAHYSRKKSSHW